MKKRSKSTAPLIQYLGSQSFNSLVAQEYVPLSQDPNVRIAVARLAELVSNMSIHLLQNTDLGNKRVSNGLERLIDIEPAKGMTRKAWLTKLIWDLFVYGDGNSIFQIIAEPGTDYLSELRPLDMSHISYQYDVTNSKLQVYYDMQELNEDGLVHFLINPDPRYPLVGRGYQNVLNTVMANLKQADQTKSEFMQGKYMPNVIIKVDADTDELTSDEGRDQVRNKYLNSTKSFEPWIIPADLMDVQQVKPLTLQDIALNDSVELDKKTVARIFGVPPFLVGVGEFNKEEYNNLVNTTVASLGQMISQTLTRDILFDPSWFFQFNPRSLYAYDLNELVSSGAIMVQNGAMDRNEWRGWVGMEPREGMDEILMLENYIPSDKLGDQKKLKGGDDDGSTGQSKETDGGDS